MEKRDNEGTPTPPHGQKLGLHGLSTLPPDMVARLAPAEAILRAAEELGVIREELHRIEIAAGRAVVHADRGERLGDRAIDTAEKLRAAVESVEEALLPLLALPAQVHGAGGHLVELQRALVALAERLARVELEMTATKTLAGRSWRATSELRGEVGRLSDFILESMRRFERESAERARLDRELTETKAAAARALEEAEEASEWAEKTGQRHVDELARRASRGDEYLEKAAHQVLEDRKQWTTAKTKVVVSIFAVGGLVGTVVLAVMARC